MPPPGTHRNPDGMRSHIPPYDTFFTEHILLHNVAKEIGYNSHEHSQHTADDVVCTLIDGIRRKGQREEPKRSVPWRTGGGKTIVHADRSPLFLETSLDMNVWR